MVIANQMPKLVTPNIVLAVTRPGLQRAVGAVVYSDPPKYAFSVRAGREAYLIAIRTRREGAHVPPQV